MEKWKNVKKEARQTAGDESYFSARILQRYTIDETHMKKKSMIAKQTTQKTRFDVIGSRRISNAFVIIYQRVTTTASMGIRQRSFFASFSIFWSISLIVCLAQARRAFGKNRTLPIK